MVIRLDNQCFELTDRAWAYIAEQVETAELSNRSIMRFVWDNLPEFSIIESSSGLEFYIDRR